jgi:hypothetical protein
MASGSRPRLYTYVVRVPLALYIPVDVLNLICVQRSFADLSLYFSQPGPRSRQNGRRNLWQQRCRDLSTVNSEIRPFLPAPSWSAALGSGAGGFRCGNSGPKGDAGGGQRWWEAAEMTCKLAGLVLAEGLNI